MKTPTFQVSETIQGYLDKLPLDKKTTEAKAKYEDTAKEDDPKFKIPPLGKPWPNFNIGNHDNSRAASRFGHKLLDAMNMVIMMLQGSSVTYYGDELGMEDYDAVSNNGDKRNLYRTPMQWDTPANAGMSSSGSYI